MLKSVLSVDGVVVPVKDRTTINLVVLNGRQLGTAESGLTIIMKNTRNGTVAEGKVLIIDQMYINDLPNQRFNYSNESNMTVFTKGTVANHLQSDFNASIKISTSTYDYQEEASLH